MENSEEILNETWPWKVEWKAVRNNIGGKAASNIF